MNCRAVLAARFPKGWIGATVMGEKKPNEERQVLEKQGGMGMVEMFTLRSSEVNDVAVFFEHIDFFNCLDGLDVEFLQGCLELLVVRTGCLVDFLHLPSGGSFTAVGVVIG